jgi:L-rhamnose mutarotase
MKSTAITDVYLMHKTLRLVLLMAALLLGGTFAAGLDLTETQPTSQAQAPKYAVFEFMKIEPGKSAEYRKMEREIWMPIHRERIKLGLIKSWSLWGMRFPGGTSREYDAIALTTFDKFTDVENSYPPEVFKKAHPRMTDEERDARTTATRKMVRTEVVTVLDSTEPSSSTQQPRYAFIGYMKPEYGKTRQYVELERQYWKPIHQERVSRGILRSWSLYLVRFPGGTDRAYSHFTVQLLNQFQDLETQYPTGIWDKVHPNVKEAEIDARTNAARKMVRTDVLTMLEHVP